MKNKLKILAELTKIKITSFVTLTTIVGYLAYSGEFNLQILFPVFGILFLACGSATINHIQERSIDALMSRTKYRPIPSGRIMVKNANLIALSLLIIGSIILYFGSGILPLGLALLNLVWYNLIYTPLKKKSSLAIIPGALVGAIPPAVGWVAAGGYIFDKEILILSSFFFIWQIPHFWLLMMSLDKEYQQAGLPTVTSLFSKIQLAKIIFVWIFATVITGLLIPFFNLMNFSIIYFVLVTGGVFLTLSAVKLLSWKEENISFRFTFRNINLFALLLVVLVSIDKLVK